MSGRAVNAVYAWTHSWDMGAQPDNPDAWEKASKAITEQLLDWVNEASAGIAFDPDNLKLTSVHASGTTGLLQIGADAQQIVVGSRSLGRVTRWFVGSLSSSLAESAKVPVTVVRIAGNEDKSVQDDIAHSLAPVCRFTMMTMSWPRPRANVRWSSAWTVRDVPSCVAVRH